MRRASMLAALLAACGGEATAEREHGEERATPSGEAEAPPGEQPERTAEDPGAAAFREAVRRTVTHLDLAALLHLADVEQDGLFADFGTAARLKYTAGRWRNGWGTDVTANDTTFTRLGESGRLYLPIARAVSHTLRLRLRRIGTDAVVVYLNGETLRTLELGDGVRDYDVELPAEQLFAGENEVMLRATATRSVGSEAVSVEVDSLRLVAGALSGGAYEPPVAPPADVEIGGERRRAVSVRAPSTVTFHLAVPRGGALAIGAGGEGGRAVVRLTPEGGAAEELLALPLAGRWTDRLVPLERFEGKLVRLDLVMEGSGRGAWSAPAVVVPLPERRPPSRPVRNVIVLLIDTLRADRLRVYDRRTRVRTPVLDRVATESVVFDRAQSPENWTKPSVASVLTGLLPMTHRTKDQTSSLSPEALMLSEVFQAAGFDTAMFSANGYVSDRFGFQQGWDHYTNYIREERSTRAETVFGEAIDWIEAHRAERFFVYIQTIDPHVPYDPPERFLRMYMTDEYAGTIQPRRTGLLLDDAKRPGSRVEISADDQRYLEALYDGEISYHDEYLGRFLDRLAELGLAEDLVFVVVSDHGEEFRDHGSWGHGHSVYQELLHVPLMVRWPALGTAGSRVAETVSTMDLAPTVLEAAGIEVPEAFEARSLRPYLLGHPRPGPAVAFSEFLDDRRVIRAGRWKLVLRSNLSTVLFDLERDPDEEHEIDRRAADPVVFRFLRIHLAQLLGASDRRDWLHSGSGAAATALPAGVSEIDPALCAQLLALGYVDARCER